MRNSFRRLLLVAEDRIRAWRLETRTATAIAAAFFIALAIVLLTTQLSGFSFRLDPREWEAGKTAKADLIADRNFPFMDEKATELKREARKKIVPPVFRYNAEAVAEAFHRYDSFSETVIRLSREDASEEKAFLKLQVDFPGIFARTDVHAVYSYPDMERALVDARRVLESILQGAIVNLSASREEILNANGIELWREIDGKIQTEEVPLNILNTTESISRMAVDQIDQTIRAESERGIVTMLIKAFAVENAFYDAQNTLFRRARAGESVEPVVENVKEGERLAIKDQVISESTAAKIRALAEYANTVNVNGIIGSALFLLLVFAAALYLLSSRGLGGASLRRGQINLIIWLSLVYLLIAALSVRFFQLPSWFPSSVAIPAAAFTMLISILVSLPMGIAFTLAVSLAVPLLTGFNMQAFLFALLSGIAGTAAVMNADRRIDLIRAGLILCILNCALLLITGLLSNLEPGRLLPVVAAGAVNGFSCGVLTLGLLPLLEHLLNSPTRFRLMELSDLNSPIFKRMLSLAPGTFTHSTNVANLAETACEAIGANALLARVAAYFHDIGKIDQADYFIENQKRFNKHDGMKASLSAAVIKSHVRIGIEKAKELALPQAIIDIIAQHHGRGLITYFYNRAVNEEKNRGVSKDDFSYPGVRPKSKEAAVLMLADAVEAASRTLKKPTEARLERLVREVIDSKLKSDELGDSTLTLRDLETIRKSFVRILEGYFHTRIEYPKLKSLESAEKAEA